MAQILYGALQKQTEFAIFDLLYGLRPGQTAINNNGFRAPQGILPAANGGET